MLQIIRDSLRELDNAKETAYAYSYAMANYDIAAATPYSTPETQNTTLKFAQKLVEKADSNYIKSDTPAQIEILHVEKSDDTTAFAVYHKTTPLKDFCDTVWMRQRNKFWLVHSPM